VRDDVKQTRMDSKMSESGIERKSNTRSIENTELKRPYRLSEAALARDGMQGNKNQKCRKSWNRRNPTGRPQWRSPGHVRWSRRISPWTIPHHHSTGIRSGVPGISTLKIESAGSSPLRNDPNDHPFRERHSVKSISQGHRRPWSAEHHC